MCYDSFGWVLHIALGFCVISNAGFLLAQGPVSLYSVIVSIKIARSGKVQE